MRRFAWLLVIVFLLLPAGLCFVGCQSDLTNLGVRAGGSAGPADGWGRASVGVDASLGKHALFSDAPGAGPDASGAAGGGSGGGAAKPADACPGGRCAVPPDFAPRRFSDP